MSDLINSSVQYGYKKNSRHETKDQINMKENCDSLQILCINSKDFIKNIFTLLLTAYMS